MCSSDLLTSIGTLFAFVLVCGGVLVLQTRIDKPESKFKVPFINGQFIFPGMVITAVVLILIKAPEHFINIWTWETFPMALFWIVTLIMTGLAYQKKLSLLPILGMISCFYLMAQESHTNWNRFLLWLTVGLIIYFSYSYRSSNLSIEKDFKRAPHSLYLGISLIFLYTMIWIILKDIYITRSIIYFNVVLSIMLRVIYSFWAARVAKKLGKSSQSWGVFAFFLTIPALIALGFQKKEE